MASITMSAPATAVARSLAPCKRPKVASRASSVTFPRATPLSRFARTRDSPLSTSSAVVSNRRVAIPAAAQTWAIPWPIVPAPRTATVFIVCA